MKKLISSNQKYYVRPIHVITAITEDTPFSKVGKVFQNDEEKSEESIDVEQGARRD